MWPRKVQLDDMSEVQVMRRVDASRGLGPLKGFHAQVGLRIKGREMRELGAFYGHERG